MFDSENARPLWSRARPQNFQGYYDTSQLKEIYERFLQSPFSLILYGPPGSGKTTFAEILMRESNLPHFSVAATSVSLEELRKIGEKEKRRHILFIDEFHRFAKARQDYLLKPIEDGSLVLIGATTESPWYYFTQPMLSRVTIKQMRIPGYSDFESIIRNSLKEAKVPDLPEETLSLVLRQTWPDFRKAYNAIEYAVSLTLTNTPQPEAATRLLEYFRENRFASGHTDSEEYDLLSAFIKSERGSDADSAMVYMARMLNIGTDPTVIARRLVILASEDVGLANSQGLVVATSALTSIEKTGMPEARIILSHAALYLALSPKSNSAYLAIDTALKMTEKVIPEIPDYLRNHPKDKSQYKYPHDFGGYAAQNYYPLNYEKIPIYQPSDDKSGASLEKKLNENVRALKRNQ